MARFPFCPWSLVVHSGLQSKGGTGFPACVNRKLPLSATQYQLLRVIRKKYIFEDFSAIFPKESVQNDS
jgi:hypothetical protein